MGFRQPLAYFTVDKTYHIEYIINMRKITLVICLLFLFLGIDIFAQSAEPSGVLLVEYDVRGNKIHEKKLDGTELWYDAQGRTTHKKNADGLETWTDYDDAGKIVSKRYLDKEGKLWNYDGSDRLIHIQWPDGYEEWYGINRNKNHSRSTDGHEVWYDGKGNKTREINSDGSEEWFDSSGRIIFIKWADGYSEWYDEYNQAGDATHGTGSDGIEFWLDYDDKGNLAHIRYSNGDEEWYDEAGKVIHAKWDGGQEQWFDDNGKLIHIKYSDGSEEWFDENGNVIEKGTP